MYIKDPTQMKKLIQVKLRVKIHILIPTTITKLMIEKLVQITELIMKEQDSHSLKNYKMRILIFISKL